jgi:hypothetical protein
MVRRWQAATRRGRFLHRLNSAIDNWNDAHCEARWFEACESSRHWSWLTPSRVPPWLCGMLRAHEAENDQCGRPEHRFCGWCSKLMPHAEVLHRGTWVE